jgi:hypothetical protein
MQPHGELLIGGETLHRLEVELEQVDHEGDACDWMLAGRLRISQEQAANLEVQRHYLLQLDDGRAGPIAVIRVEPYEGQFLAIFRPDPRRPR